MSKLSITSASQLSHLLNNNPSLLTIPAFSRLSTLINHLNTQPKTGCSSCGGKTNPYAQIRPQLETALTSMTDQDFLTMKSMLNVEQICYYRQDQVTKKLIQVCL